MNIQFFARESKGKDNIKALRETRAEKVEELKLLYATLESEERAITEDEEKRAESLNDEIKRIDKTIDILDKMKKALKNVEKEKNRKMIQKREMNKEQKMRKEHLQIISEE